MRTIKNKLSMTIFNDLYEYLSKNQKEFINIYSKRYYEYLKKIRVKLCEVEDKKKLSGHEYRLIERWFFDRIPEYCVLQGIEEGSMIAKQYGHVIYSAGYFKPHIKKIYLKYRERIVADVLYRYGKSDKWFWKIFLYWKNHEFGESKFDIFEGIIFVKE